MPCDGCRDTRYWRWSVVLAEADVLLAAGMTGPLQSLSVAKTGPGDRAVTLRVVAAGETRDIPAADFRLRLGAQKLRSTRILSMERTQEGMAIEGAGWGHGVGLCQESLRDHARDGWSAERMLLHYYPGARVEQLPLVRDGR